MKRSGLSGQQWISRAVAGAALLLMTFGVGVVSAQTPLTTERVASGLERPIFVTHAPDDYSRLFVIEKRGRIRIIKDGVLLATPFLDIDANVGGGTSNNSEQGLLGLAFHPDFESNGYFYVDFTNNSGNTVVRRHQVSAGDPDIADPNAMQVVLRVNQQFSNHNGGWIGFGPDNYLYVALGDGGSGCDPNETAQNATGNLLGSMLRLDIDGDDFPGDTALNYAIPADNPFVEPNDARLDEIWAYGLRNPWRNSFDRVTGDLWIADVGQSQREEVDFQPAASTGGENYGWDCKEGTECSSISGCGSGACNCLDPNLVDPIHEYTHADGCSITGGYVYRGCAIPDLDGTYFFADYCDDTIWTLQYDGAVVSNFMNRTSELAPGGGLNLDSITSFGEDAYGELYICDQNGGEVFKIVPDVPGGIVGEDCDNSGIDDACELAAGQLHDVNNDGDVDECDACHTDLNGDNMVTSTDLSVLLSNFGTTVGATFAQGDIDGDGDVDSTDLSTLLSQFGADCTS